jgi:hypothetical protein
VSSLCTEVIFDDLSIKSVAGSYDIDIQYCQWITSRPNFANEGEFHYDGMTDFNGINGSCKRGWRRGL